MSFYLEPPTGNISLQQIEAFAFKRLDFLFKVYEFEGDIERLAVSVDSHVLGSECLIEGTAKDEISHFILRLAMCLEADTSKFFTQAEMWLFNFRFLSMSEEELWHFFRRIDRKSQRVHKKFVNNPHLSEMISVLKIIKSESGCWRTVVQRYKQADDKHGFAVPFYVVPGLVKTRLVAVHRGSALVPYCHLDVVMSSLFKQILLWGVNRAAEQRETTQSDPRIRSLTKHLQMKFRQCCKPHTDYRTMLALSHDEVERVLPWFPPCMSHLHRKLRQKHRLHHHSRIQYTLFLKEIGMPVHENVKFWKKEYSIPVDNKDGRCCHDWKSDGRRYTYNIRHLYGLEGACTNYRGHCCTSLQNTSPGHGDSGGCPFVHFDLRHLDDLLHIEGVSDTGEIIQLVREGKHTKACQKLFELKTRNVCQKCSVNESHGSSAQTRVQKRKNIDWVDSNSKAGTDKKSCQRNAGNRQSYGALPSPCVVHRTDNNSSTLQNVCKQPMSSCTMESLRVMHGADANVTLRNVCEQSMSSYTTDSTHVVYNADANVSTLQNVCKKSTSIYTAKSPHVVNGADANITLRNVCKQSMSSCTTEMSDSRQDGCDNKPNTLLLDLDRTINNSMTKQSRKCEVAFTVDRHNRKLKSKGFLASPNFDKVMNCEGLETTPVLCDRMLTDDKGDGDGSDDASGEEEEDGSNDVSDCQLLPHEREDEKGVQCFDHDICPSQMCRTKQQNVSTTYVPILKPADFYSSFQELAHGLMNLNMKV